MSKYNNKKNNNSKVEKEVLIKGYQNINVLDPQIFYQTMANDKGVKLIENKHPFFQDITIVDLSLSGKGFSEDKIYADFVYYRNNIRRGNSVAKLQQGNKCKYFWIRRGLKKFFDVDLESLRGKQGNHQHTATFRQIQNALSCNSNFERKQDKAFVAVYKTLKANGQNSQVSYFAVRDLWMISSKNVAVLAGTRNHLEKYTEERYKFAVLIAHTWFDMLEKSNYTQNQLNQIKQYCASRTLIGQYCGNPEYQHIIKYEQTVILFYAAVQHDSPNSAQPPNQTFAFLQKYKIPIVRGYQKSLVGRFDKYQELVGFVEKLFVEVATAKIQDQEEGSVLYFTVEANDVFYKQALDSKLGDRFYIPQIIRPFNAHVSSLCKLKTLQYRILRKLRQKLKRIKSEGKPYNGKQFDYHKQFQKTYSKFEKQTFQLIGKQKMLKPVEYYFLVGLKAFQYIKTYRSQPGALVLQQNAYIDFLNIILHCIDANKNVTPNLMNDKQLVIKLRGIDWATYNTKVEEEYEKLLNSLVPYYVKIKGLKGVEKDKEQKQQIEVEPQ